MFDTLVVGLDVSQATLDVAAVPREAPSPDSPERPHTRQVPNTAAGHKRLVAWLARLSAEPTHVCLEATGSYWEAVAEALHDAGHQVSVLNPYQAKQFAHALLRRTKTDRADAHLLALACRALRLRLWAPPSAALRHLRDLVRVREGLLAVLLPVRHRAHASGAVPVALDVWTDLGGNLRDRITAVERALAAHVQAHPELAAQVRLLCTIPGISRLTAYSLLAELGDLSRFRTVRQVAAYVGLAPTQHQSGTSVRGASRLPSHGQRRLRRALYWPAITAIRCAPPMAAFSDRLTARGKAKKQAIAAVMHKLLRIAVAVLRSGEPYRAPASTTTP